VGTVLAAALQLGISQASLDVAVAYSLEREQFGAKIGSFQALKHIMADMVVRVGLARSATYAAAAVLDDPAVGDADRSVGGAKLLAGEAAVENARASIQVMGGMGFTWEMPPHFLLKRALVLDQTFGTPTSHALALGASLEKEVA
jgi:alkylation response protein AidB-like acyl-CoA dehydrogenase